MRNPVLRFVVPDEFYQQLQAEAQDLEVSLSKYCRDILMSKHRYAGMKSLRARPDDESPSIYYNAELSLKDLKRIVDAYCLLNGDSNE